MKKDGGITRFERYLTNEIGIEFKSCLYFFAILFFYSMYRIINGIYDASILHMAEMIFTCYGIGYLQAFVFWNFDEADSLKAKEWIGIACCTLIYTLISFAGGWFDRSIKVTAVFAAYLIFTYICVFLIYKCKRTIDDKKLNEDLQQFKSRHQK